MNVNTLMPGRWLNDAIVNFWIKWVSVPRSPNDLASKVHVFSSHFLSSVLTNNYSSGLKRWLRKINIFEKKLLLFPFHGAGHWSLVAVFNPSLIKQTSRRWGDASYSNEVACMVHFDSLGQRTTHSGRDISWAVRLVLNSEWDRHYNVTLDRTARPFTHRCLPLLTPKVVYQNNSVDCGLFTCRYAFNAIELLKKPVKMSDIHDKLRRYVSDEPLFNFTRNDITRMRVEIHNMLGSITEQYRSHRAPATNITEELDGVAVNLFADSDNEVSEDDDDDDVVLITNDMKIGDDSSDCSGSNWSKGIDELSLDEEEALMYDSSGEFLSFILVVVWHQFKMMESPLF
jgi:Ulp1 family protease